MGKIIMVDRVLSEQMIQAGESVVERLDSFPVIVDDVFWYRRSEEVDWKLVLTMPGLSFYGPLSGYEHVQRVLSGIPDDILIPDLDQITLLDTDEDIVQALRHSLTSPFQRSHYGLNRVRLNRVYFEGFYIYRLAETIQITCDLVLDAGTESSLKAWEGNRLGGGDVYVWARGLPEVPGEKVIAHGSIEPGESPRVVIDMPAKYGIDSCEGLRCESFTPGKASVLGTRWEEGPMTLSVNHVKLTPAQ